MGEVVTKNVTTGKRNTIQNNDMGPKGDISLPIKKFEAPPVTPGRRDTVLDAGGQKKPTG